MVHRLRQSFGRIVIPDLLGHGLSAVPSRPMRGFEVQQAIDEALDVLVEEPAVVYGNSLGGYGAIRFAARAPERTRVLVVNSPGGAELTEVSMQEYMDRFRIQSHSDALTFLDLYLSKRIPMKSLLAYRVSQQLNKPPIKSFINEICEDDYLKPEQLAQLSMPVLFLWGKNDQVMVPEQLDFFRRHLPSHVQVEEPEEYGHAPYIEHPAHLSDWLLRFTREHLE
jgi:pimeloyl-ACP methyl ester carboxylesterase